MSNASARRERIKTIQRTINALSAELGRLLEAEYPPSPEQLFDGFDQALAEAEYVTNEPPRAPAPRPPPKAKETAREALLERAKRARVAPFDPYDAATAVPPPPRKPSQPPFRGASGGWPKKKPYANHKRPYASSSSSSSSYRNDYATPFYNDDAASRNTEKK